MSKTLLHPGIFVADEIYRSGNPAAHALAIANNARDYGFGWVALQLVEENKQWASALRNACQAAGLLFCGWSQGKPWAEEKKLISEGGWNFNGYIPNVETPGENAEYVNNGAIEWLKNNYLHLGVIFTEGAWGKNPDGTYNRVAAAPWRDFVGMPEAFLPVSTSWNAQVMSFVASQFGFTKIAPTIGLWGGGISAAHYTPTMDGVRSWSIWRYVGISGADFIETQKWARLPDEVTPPPPPPPPPPVGITVEEAHKRAVENRNLVNQRIAPNVLGPNSVLELSHDMSKAVLDKKPLPPEALAKIRGVLTQYGLE